MLIICSLIIHLLVNTTKPGFCLQDESHNLKSPKTLRTKTGSALVGNCKRCILLSGTPALSRPNELFCQLKCIRPKIFKKSVPPHMQYLIVSSWMIFQMTFVPVLWIMLNGIVMPRGITLVGIFQDPVT